MLKELLCTAQVSRWLSLKDKKTRVDFHMLNTVAILQKLGFAQNILFNVEGHASMQSVLSYNQQITFAQKKQ